MADLHIPANTAANGIPSGAGVHTGRNAEDLKPEVDHELEAKRQARRGEGFHTSERLERIDGEIVDNEQLKADTEAKLDEAAPAVADGVKGAQGRYQKLADELRACEDRIDALKRARTQEEQHLRQAYADKVERAQELHRQRIRDRVSDARTKLETVEADLRRLEHSMAEATAATKQAAALSGSPDVGRHAEGFTQSLAHIIGVRLGMHGDPGPGSSRELPVHTHALQVDEVIRRAEIPDYLADLPDPDADA